MFLFWLIFVVFISVFTQSAIGFGLALIAMPLLSTFLELNIVSPLIALVGIITKIVLLIHYREEVNINEVWKLALASLIFVPVGVWALDILNQEISLIFLGIVIIGYALYNLLDLSAPVFNHPAWPYFFGSIAGFLGGAFNTAGPPIVIYVNTRNWSPQKFKSNLQGYSLITGVFIVFNHWLRGNLTAITWEYFIYTIPAILSAVWVGIYMDRFMQNDRFRQIILIALLIIGIQLLF